MLNRAREIQDQLVHWRRDIHMHPELGFEEIRTAGIVAEELHNLGLTCTQGLEKLALLALFKVNNRGQGFYSVLIWMLYQSLKRQVQSTPPKQRGSCMPVGMTGMWPLAYPLLNYLKNTRQIGLERLNLFSNRLRKGWGEPSV